MLNYVLRNYFQLDLFPNWKIMPFVYFNFQQEISIYFTILTFSLSCFTFNIGDFLRHETILAVSRTVSHAALPVPSQESQKIPVCNISRVYCDVTKVSRPGLSSQNRSGPGITRRGESVTREFHQTRGNCDITIVSSCVFYTIARTLLPCSIPFIWISSSIRRSIIF